MNFAHSFWSKPLLEQKFDSFEKSLRIILYSYTMSAEMVRAYGHNITLYTDKYGAELLGFAPYNEVVVIDIPQDQSKHFAAQIKFEALKRMKLGEILIDGDLFLWRSGVYEIIRQSVVDVLYAIYENNEFILGSKANIKLLDKMSTVKYESPYKIPRIDEVGWPNTCLLKFNNQQLKDEYIAQYEHHKNLLQDIDFEDVWPDIIIEQYFLKVLCDSKGYTYKPVMEDIFNNEDKAVNLGFTHLGGAKEKFLFLAVDWIRNNDIERYNIINKKLEELT